MGCEKDECGGGERFPRIEEFRSNFLLESNDRLIDNEIWGIPEQNEKNTGNEPRILGGHS